MTITHKSSGYIRVYAISVRQTITFCLYLFFIFIASSSKADDIFNNINATDLYPTKLCAYPTDYRYFTQRFTTTDKCLVQTIELMLRKSSPTATGTFYVDIFTDKDNYPDAYWRIATINLSDLGTAFSKYTINTYRPLLANTNYWVSICGSGNWLEWAYTSTVYPAPTAYSYWSWQAELFEVVDTRSFPQVMRVNAVSIPPPVRPWTQASNLAFSKIMNYQAGVSCLIGSGRYRAIFIKATDTGSPTVNDLQTYTANSIYGQGSNDGNGWYCIANGEPSSVTVSGLNLGTTYRVMAIEYNGETGSQLYNTSVATGNPANFTTSTVCVSLPGNPDPIIGSSNVCSGTNGAAYAIRPVLSATSYVWSFSGTGATINGTGNSVTIDFSNSATNGILNVKGKSDCGEGSTSLDFPITVNPLPNDAGTIVGTPSVNAGSTGVSYSVADITNATSYAWSYSGAGVTINGTSKSVTIDFLNTATSGILTVKGRLIIHWQFIYF